MILQLDIVHVCSQYFCAFVHLIENYTMAHTYDSLILIYSSSNLID